MKDIKDYIHLYWGCEVSVKNIDSRYTRLITHEFINSYYDEDSDSFLNDPKLLLRPLQYADREEIEHIIYYVMDSAVHLDSDARFTIDEVKGCIESTEPDDNAIVVYFSVRCYSGNLYLSQHSGLIRLFNEEEKEEAIEFNPELYRYLLSKGFDLFGLIDAGLAIDKTKLSDQ